MVRYQSDAMEIEVNTGTEGVLFLSDPFYPGWRAEVDGKPAPILRANYAFRAIPVPAGSHRVTMTFRPASWYIGLGISGLTVLMIGFLSGLAYRLRSRPATQERHRSSDR